MPASGGGGAGSSGGRGGGAEGRRAGAEAGREVEGQVVGEQEEVSAERVEGSWVHQRFAGQGRVRARALDRKGEFPKLANGSSRISRHPSSYLKLCSDTSNSHGQLLFHPTYSAAILAFLEQTVTEMLRRADNITDLSPVLYLGKRDWHKCSVYERLVVSLLRHSRPRPSPNCADSSRRWVTEQTIDAAVGFLKAYEGVDLPADAGKSGLSAEEKEAIRRREAGEVEAEMDVTGESRASQTMAEQT